MWIQNIKEISKMNPKESNQSIPENILANWQTKIQNLLYKGSAICTGLFDRNGQTVYANHGMEMLLSMQNAQEPSVDVFVNPTFKTLIDLDKQKEPVFEGCLTVKSRENSFISLKAVAFFENDHLLLHGEYDVAQIETMNIQLTSMNREINNTQRELIRAKKRLEMTLAKLKTTQEKLIQSEKMASLGRMVAGFAHEINTPIGVALTASSSVDNIQKNIFSMLSEEEVHEEDLVDNLQSIGDASKLILKNLKRAGDLVHSFKKTAIDQSSDTARLFSIHENINDTITSLNHKFKRTQIKINVNCPFNLNIYGYPGVISQIITNLLENSLKYAFDDGLLNGDIHITVKKMNQTILISYWDNGKGMDETTRKNIFEPFYTTGRNRGGTGLGLFICFNLITNKLEGEINCQSEPGKGAMFNIQFPIKEIGNERTI
jgi:signal transduction histidine kinase